MYRGAILALTVAGLTTASWAAISQPQQVQPRSAQQASAANQRGTEQLPLVVETRPQPKTQAEIAKNDAAEKEKAESDRKLVELTEQLTIYTGLLFLATLVMAVGTGLLWWATKTTINDGRKSSERELRAYLTVAKGFLHGVGGSDPWAAVISLQNGGRTPAFNVRTSYSVQGDNFPIERPMLAIPEISDDAGSTIMGPGGRLTLHVPMLDVVDATKTQQLLSGEAIVWITGRVTYDDVFGHARWTTFRYFCGGEMKWLHGALAPFHVGNDAGGGPD